jgi:quercetin dioxygenase-like cupin family protein
MILQAAPRHHFTYGGSAISVYHVGAGEGLPRHEHSHAHATICVSGSCVIRKANRELIMTKETQPVNLLPNEWHEIEALQDETVFINVISI